MNTDPTDANVAVTRSLMALEMQSDLLKFDVDDLHFGKSVEVLAEELVDAGWVKLTENQEVVEKL